MIVVSRPIGGTSLNGIEFLLNEDCNDYMLFESKEKAKEFLLEHSFPDATDEELEDYFRFITKEEALAYEQSGA